MTRPGHGADRLLAMVRWLLPPRRQEWGRAMSAELAALPTPGERWAFAASCVRVAVRPGLAARYLLPVFVAAVVTRASGAIVALQVEMIGLGIAVPVSAQWLSRRDVPVGAVGPTRTARVARRVCLGVLACCVVAGIQTIAVTLPREGSVGSASGPVTGLTLLLVFLAGYAAAGLAATSAAADVPPATLVAIGGCGTAAGLGWSLLMPFDQTLSVPGPWRTVLYGLALAVTVVALPAGAAVIAVRRSNDRGQGLVAGFGTGGLAALIILAGGWAMVRLAPQLLDSRLLDKGPQWRPPDVVEQVVTSYLVILVLAPLVGALMGALATTRRPAAVPGLALAALLVYPGLNALVAHDHTAFGGVGSTAVVFSPAGSTLLTGNADNTWILWNVTDPGHPHRLLTFNDDVRYSPDGRTLASRNTLWSLADPIRPVRTAEYNGGRTVAFSADGTLVATHRTPTTTTLWRLADRRRPVRLGAMADGGDGAFSPDGHTYVTVDDTRTILWDITDPARPTRLTGLPGINPQLSFGRGPSITTTTDDGTALWNIADPRHPRRVGALGDTTGRAVDSPDGRTVAVSDHDGDVTLFDTTTAARTATLPSVAGNVQIGASDTLTTVAFAPDGHSLSVIDGNTTVSRWDLTDPTHPVRTEIRTRRTDGAGQVAFSADTRTVAGAAVDGSNTVSLWRLP